MNNIWFTADTHFGHDRIIKYCNRPFSSAEEMDEVILQRFNEVIKKGDTLYHLGDISWSTFNLENLFSRLNTKQILLIKGNHDNRKDSEYAKYCQLVTDYRSVTISGVQTILFHYPIRSWVSKGHGGYHLYGHCHGTVPGLNRSMDVGVDTHHFYPWGWEEIQARLKDLPIFTKEEGDSHETLAT